MASIINAVKTQPSFRVLSCSDNRVRQLWKLTLLDREDWQVTVRLDNQWLLITAPLPGSIPDRDPYNPDRYRELGSLMARTPPPVKLAMDSNHNLVLNAELPFCPDTDMAARLHETLEVVRIGIPSVHAAIRGVPEPHLCVPSASSALELEALAAESGWPYTNRSDNRFAVSLEVGPEVYRAVLALTPEHHTRVSAELPVGPNVSTHTLAAATKLALRANHVLRMVRFSLAVNDDAACISASVDFISPPSLSEFSHACSALSIACRRCAAEAKMLFDERVSTAFLAA